MGWTASLYTTNHHSPQGSAKSRVATHLLQSTTPCILNTRDNKLMRHLFEKYPSPRFLSCQSPHGALGGGDRGIDRGSNPTALCYPLGSRGCLCRFVLDGTSAMVIGISLVYLSEVLKSKESWELRINSPGAKSNTRVMKRYGDFGWQQQLLLGKLGFIKGSCCLAAANHKQQWQDSDAKRQCNIIVLFWWKVHIEA